MFFAILRSLLLFFLHLVEERPELLRKSRELIVVYDALLLARLEVLQRLDLVLGQILPILLTKCAKFIIIQSIILSFLLFNWTLPGKFGPANCGPRPFHLTNYRESFGHP